MGRQPPSLHANFVVAMRITYHLCVVLAPLFLRAPRLVLLALLVISALLAELAFARRAPQERTQACHVLADAWLAHLGGGVGLAQLHARCVQQESTASCTAPPRLWTASNARLAASAGLG